MRHRLRKKMNQPGFSPGSPIKHPGLRDPEVTKKKLQAFLIKLTLSSALVLASIMIHRGILPVGGNLNKQVSQMLWTDFQFSKVDAWYQKISANPLALLTLSKSGKDQTAATQSTHFALPVNGQVMQTYTKKQNGMMIRVDKATTIKAVEDGVVTFSGKKSGTGNTIIIQHSSGTESIYGDVLSIVVKPYQHVKKGENIAKIKPTTNESYGVFYFALKKDNQFINPLQVIPFD